MKSFIAIACILTMMAYAAYATPTPKRAGSVRGIYDIFLANQMLTACISAFKNYG